MSYQVSARKWRPQTFSEVVGQSHVAKTLMNAVRQGRIAQAYLFSGSRGVGKTTMARILAKALNCSEREKGDGVTPCQTCESCQGITAGTSPDVIEIDGASNRGIDEVRELREVVKYAPMGGRHKVYIIDEVHMLTKEAFNALLKTLEEPPPHIVFVFATTEDNKIPTTILSRCQHFNFKRISRQETSDQLKKIIGEENLELSDRGLSMIAKAAEGSLRDALSLLDQAVAYAGKAVSDEDLQTILGTAGREQVLVMLEHVIERRTAEGLSLVKELSDQGYDLRQFTLSLVEYFRHLVVARETKNPGELIDLPPDEIEEVRRMAEKTGTEEVQRLFGIFSAAVEGFRTAVYPSFVLEMALVRATRIPPLESFEKLLERMEGFESSGSEVRPRPAAPRRNPESKNQAGKVENKGDPKPEHGSGEIKPAPVEEVVPPAGYSGIRGNLQEQWADLVQRIRIQKPNLGSYLQEGVIQEIAEEKGRNWLVVGFHDGSSFLADFIQKDENRSVIEEAAREVFGLPVGLRTIRVERSPEELEQAHQAEEDKVELRKKKIKKDALSNPLMKEALDILGGEVIDIRES